MNLLGILMGLTVSAILAMEAIPSYVHANQQQTLQVAVNNLKVGLGYNPPTPAATTLDPSWSVPAARTYEKTFTAPVGVLQVVQPLGAGGSFSCQFSAPGFNLRC